MGRLAPPSSPSVLQALRTTDWTRYPGDDEGPLRRALAERAAVPAQCVALGNGSAELIWLLGLATLRPGDTVAVLGPTFGEYARAARILGAQPVEVHDPDDVPAGARLVFLCNPNNPTGDYHARAVVEGLLAADPERLVVLDEAYAAFVDRDQHWPSEPLLAYPNLVIVRSMTKDQALPGLRLGYLLADPQLAGAVEAVRPPWSTNSGALRAGRAALKPPAQAHVAAGRAVVHTARHLLTHGLTALGWHVRPSRANFVLVEVGDGAAFRRALLAEGRIVVRDCASFGLPQAVRIACRQPDDCRRLLDGCATLAGAVRR